MEVMEVTLFLIVIMANITYGRSYEMHNSDEHAPSEASFIYGESDFENVEFEMARVKNLSKRNYASGDKSTCWLSGSSFALRSEEELLYQPYENQTDLILTSRDCLPQPVRISMHHKHISKKVLHFSILNYLYIFMDNQTIYKTRRNIVSRLFCKTGHSTIIFSLAPKMKLSYKHIHRFGKNCPKTFLNNSQIRNYYQNNHRRIPHMDLLFGIMIILVILVTCFLRLIYWFRIKAMTQQRQIRSQQRRQLIDLTRPSRVSRRIELPPSYNEIQQQEEPPPSYDAVYKRLLATAETPPKNSSDGGESPRLDCVSDPPPEYYELYENLTAINASESNINCEVDCNTFPERNSDEVTGTSSSNYEETLFSKCNTKYSDQVSLNMEALSKSAQTSTIVDDKVESVRLNPCDVSCTKVEVNLVPLILSDRDNLNIATESIRLPEIESDGNELSTTKSTSDSINV